MLDKNGILTVSTIEIQSKEKDTDPKIENYFVTAKNPFTVEYPLFAQLHQTKGLVIDHLADPERGQKIIDLSGFNFICFAQCTAYYVSTAEVSFIAEDKSTSELYLIEVKDTDIASKKRPQELNGFIAKKIKLSSNFKKL